MVEPTVTIKGSRMPASEKPLHIDIAVKLSDVNG